MVIIKRLFKVSIQNVPGNAMSLFFMEWVRGAFLISILPSLATDRWGLTLALVGTAVSIHYLTDNLVKGLVGLLLDRFPAKYVLHGGYVLALMGLCFILFIHLPWVLLLSSGLLGIGFAPVWLVCLSQIREDKRAEQMGKLYIFWLAGLGLGPLTINLFLDYGYRATLLMLAGMFIVGWLFVGKGNTSNRSVTSNNVPLRQQFEHLWVRIRQSGGLLPGMVLQTTAAGMLVPFISSFAVKQVGLSHGELSLVMLTGGAFAVGALIPFGKWYDRTHSHWFLIVGFGMISLSLLELLFVHSFRAMEVIVVILGVSYASLLPAWNALMAQYIPQHSQGTGWGIFSTVEGLGIVIGPLIGSGLTLGGNVAIPFAVSAVLFGLISLYYCFFRLNPICLSEES
jgi:MFS family permease